MITPTLDQLKRGLQIAEQIAALEVEMASIFIGVAPDSAVNSTPTAKAAAIKGKKSKRSPGTIARMKAAQQAQWARIKEEKAPVTSDAPAMTKAEVPTKRRTMSSETKAKLAAAMKARWASAKKSGSPAPTAKKK